MHHRGAGERRGDTGEHQQCAGGKHFDEAKAPDQRAGKERRCEHADDVPLEDECRIAKRVLAHVHGDRRRRHEQVHDAVAAGSGKHGDDEGGLAGDFAQRAASCVLLEFAQWRNLQAADQQHGDEGEDRE